MTQKKAPPGKDTPMLAPMLKTAMAFIHNQNVLMCQMEKLIRYYETKDKKLAADLKKCWDDPSGNSHT